MDGSQSEAKFSLYRILGAAIAGASLLLLAVFWQTAPSRAATAPSAITYQGRLLVNNLNATTTQSIQLRLYDSLALDSGNLLYTASGTLASPLALSVTPTSGLFSVDLGGTGTNSLSPDIFQNNQSVYLEVRVGSETLSPRKQITAAPFAFNATYLNGVAATSTASSSTYIPISDSGGNFIFNAVSTTGSFFTTGTFRTLGGTTGMGISVSSTSVTNTIISYFTSGNEGNALVFDTDRTITRNDVYIWRNNRVDIMRINVSGSIYMPTNNTGINIARADGTFPPWAQLAYTSANNTQLNNAAQTGNIHIQNTNDVGSIMFITSINTSTRMVVTASGTVGIGTVGPNMLLTIRNGALGIGNGTTSSSLEHNLFTIASSTSNAQGLFRVDSSGNISASGTLRTFGGVAGVGVSVSSTSATNTLISYFTSGNKGNALVFDTNQAITSGGWPPVDATQLYAWRNGGSEVMAITASGSLFLPNNQGISFADNGGERPSNAQFVYTNAHNTQVNNSEPTGNIHIQNTNNVGSIMFITSSNTSTRMVVTASGTVGIGTVGPNMLLTIRNGALGIGNGTTSSSLEHNLFTIASSTSNAAGLFQVNSSGSVSASGTFRVYGNLRGDVGLGIATAEGFNNVATTTLTLYTTTTNPGNSLVFNTNQTITSSTAALYSWRNNGFRLMSLSASGTLDVYGAIAAMSATVGTPGAPGDIAERVDISPTEASLAGGDLVVPDPNYPDTYGKSTAPYQTTLIGVISESPTIVVGNGKTKKTATLALTGRVPVKVSAENGSIQIGDRLTSSAQPGIAMKATRPGPTIAIALEPFDQPGVGKVLGFVQSGYYDPNQPTIAGITAAALASTGSWFAEFTNWLRAVGLTIEQGVLRIAEVITDKLTAQRVTTRELCVDDVCITKDQLRELLNRNQLQSAAPSIIDSSSVPAVSTESTSVTSSAAASAVAPASSTADSAATAPAPGAGSASAPAEPSSPASETTAPAAATPESSVATPSPEPAGAVNGP
ncbi:MAG: hypothetical protein HYV42_02490 [Candidatus Magasanikbacteria bacterium]|nr:hypothetical protein [Candidatus Magasanikbacteria bacterium]